MIEPILLSETNEKPAERKQGSGKFQWVMFIVFSFILAGAVIGLVMFLDPPKTDSSSSTPPVLTSPQMAEVCGACTLVPHMEDHVICKSCKWDRAESKTLPCPAGYGEMEFQNVKLGGKMNSEALAAVQNECANQYEENLEADFSCEFNLDTLLGVETSEQSEPTDVDPNSPVLEARHHHHKHSDVNSVKAEYTCHKTEGLNLNEERPFLQSALLSEPFLSSIQVKCSKRRLIADTVEMSKICAASGSSALEFSCPTGSDPRVIVLKMKQLTPAATLKGQRKVNKKRAQMVTNYCAAGNMNGQTCAVPPENLLLDTEDNLEGFSWDVKYMCSYGETSGSLLLSSALDLSGKASEQPSEPILESALVKCGKRKAYSSTVEVAKVCSDHDFELSCNTDGEPRVIVLSMWEGNRDTLSHKKAKRRASLATDVCTSEKFSEGICSFSLEDVLFEEEKQDPTSTVDTTFTVKYLCSYNAPTINFDEVPVEESSPDSGL